MRVSDKDRIIRVDEETYKMVSHAASFLDISNKRFVSDSIRHYVLANADSLAERLAEAAALFGVKE